MCRALLLVLVGGLLTSSAAHPQEKETPPRISPFLDSDLADWEGLVKEHWRYEDGALVGTTYPRGVTFNTFLCSKKKYRDFELSFKVRLEGGVGNSGVQIRSKVADRKTFAVSGPQCDIGESYWGNLHGERFGGLMRAARPEAQKVVKAKDFNDYHIKVVGKHVTIKLAGVTAVDDDFAKMPEEGIIAFQLHSGGPIEVTFKDIRFKALRLKK
jgi:hypothetical protein